MYNEELKFRFINERDEQIITSNNYLVNLFEKSSVTEEELNKDLCNFTFYEIEEFYKLLNASSINALSVINSHYSSYTQWCMQQNLVADGQNHFTEMWFGNFSNCINKGKMNMQVLSKEIIYDVIKQLNNPKDQFIILGLFEGIKGKDFCELANLKPEHIKGNVVQLCTGREVEISNKLLSIIEDCIETHEYYATTGKEEKVIPLVDNGYIIKDYPNVQDGRLEKRSGRSVKNSIERTVKGLGLHGIVTANNIVESGKLNMIKEQAKEKGMSCKEYICSSHLNDVKEKFNCTISTSRYIIKYEDYLL